MNVRSSPAKSGVEAAAEYAKNFSAAVSMEKARQLYLAAVKAKPGDGGPLEGAARMAAAAGEHRAAIEHLRVAVTADSKRKTTRERLIAALLHIGELASAEEEAHAALDLTSNNVALSTCSA
jgi:Flp pilus assembly protein TadD